MREAGKAGGVVSWPRGHLVTAGRERTPLSELRGFHQLRGPDVPDAADFRTPGRRRPKLTVAISAAMVELYAEFYAHDRTTATTYINDKIVVCVLEDILTDGKGVLVAGGEQAEVIDGRVAFQAETEDVSGRDRGRVHRGGRAVDPSPRGRLPECQPDHSRGGLRPVLPRCGAPRRAPSDDAWSR